MSSTRLERRNFSERVRSRAGGIVLRRMWDEQLESEKTREREELEECVRAFEDERERSKIDPGSGGLSPIAERGSSTNHQSTSTSSPRGSSGSERSSTSPRENDLLKRLATLEDELRKCQRDYKTRFPDRTRVKEIETLLLNTSLAPATSLQHTPSSVSLPETRGRNHFRAASPPPPAMPTPIDRRRLTFQQANGGGFLNINGVSGRNGMDLTSPGGAGQPSPTLPPLSLGNQGGLFAPAVGPPLPSPGLREWARGSTSRSQSRPGSRGPGNRAPTPPVGPVAVRLKE